MGTIAKRVLHIFEYGTQFTDDIEKKDRIRAFNYIMMPCFPILILLMILNISNGMFFLAATNGYVFLTGVITIIINPFPKYDLLKLIGNILLTITCTTQAICFHNGSEYFNLQNLVIVLIFFNDRKFLIPSMIVSVIGFVFAKYMMQYPPLIQGIGKGRSLFNMTWFLGMMVVGLSYFKKTQVRNKKKLEEQNKQLLLANQTKEKLFSIIAHDLRSPIAQIKGSLNLLSHQYISKEEFQSLSTGFSKQVDQLENNLNNLLSWSQSQLSGINPKAVVFSVKKVLDEAINFVQENLSQKQIGIAVDIRPTLVYMDPDHLRLVLRNLLSNAIKFSKRNRTVYISDQIYADKLFISVRDEGIGISEDKLATLFTGNLIISEKGTEQEKGNGLGLNMCKEFLELNGGAVTVSSTKGNGSIFTISIPLAK